MGFEHRTNESRFAVGGRCQCLAARRGNIYGCHRPAWPGGQYSRDGSDRADGPRRTGYPPSRVWRVGCGARFQVRFAPRN